MLDKIELREGFWWPIADQEGWASIRGDMWMIPEILEHVIDNNVIVQAGGNCGLWPIQYAKHFNEVITFEPEPMNFECLVRNTSRLTNITAYNTALSDIRTLVEMNLPNPDNCGCNYIASHNNTKPWGERVIDVTTMTIDSLELTDCNLIHLDIEGYEPLALLGAENTVKEYLPVIVLELQGAGVHYGYTDEQTMQLLADWGYRLEKSLSERDFLFLHP
jgi:FkbM family methyltransferase